MFLRGICNLDYLGCVENHFHGAFGGGLLLPGCKDLGLQLMNLKYFFDGKKILYFNI